MLVKDLIKKLQKFDSNQVVQCLGKTTDWIGNEDGSMEIDTCEWFEVGGVSLRKRSGTEIVTIYADKEDLT
jgi:hypothetical protein